MCQNYTPSYQKGDFILELDWQDHSIQAARSPLYVDSSFSNIDHHYVHMLPLTRRHYFTIQYLKMRLFRLSVTILAFYFALCFDYIWGKSVKKS